MEYGILAAMNPIESILDHYHVLIIDGALATELERRGCDLKDDLWSAKILLEQPEKIRQVHYDYFKAGADCAITASYQATIEGFSRRGLNEQEALALIQKSVRLAVEARDAFWAASDDVPEIVRRAQQASSMKANPVALTEQELAAILLKAL